MPPLMTSLVSMICHVCLCACVSIVCTYLLKNSKSKMKSRIRRSLSKVYEHVWCDMKSLCHDYCDYCDLWHYRDNQNPLYWAEQLPEIAIYVYIFMSLRGDWKEADCVPKRLQDLEHAHLLPGGCERTNAMCSYYCEIYVRYIYFFQQWGMCWWMTN